MCGCLSEAPYWGPDLQTRQGPWVGIKPATLWFTGPCSICWATPARAKDNSFLEQSICVQEFKFIGNSEWICHSIILAIKLFQGRNSDTGDFFKHYKLYIVRKSLYRCIKTLPNRAFRGLLTASATTVSSTLPQRPSPPKCSGTPASRADVHGPPPLSSHPLIHK